MAKYKKRKGGFFTGFFRMTFNLACLSAIAGACYGVYVLAQKTKDFQIKTIELAGLERVSEEDIVAASGLTAESNLLFLRSAALARRVESIPGVRTCAVSKIFPDTLVIEVEERKPIASLVLRNDMYEIDADGFVMSEIPKGAAPVWPLITDVPRLSYIEPGETIVEAELHEALAVWQAFRVSDMAADVTVAELSARHINDIRMYCDELDYELRWGRGDYVRQARRLDVLWKRQDKVLPCDQYIELRFGEQLACL